MNLEEVQNKLSVRGKNGIGFLLSGAIIWTIITVVFTLDIEINSKNVIMLFATGILFPLAILISKLIKAEWIFKDIQLSGLGVIFNVAQFIYFPIMFWAFAKDPNMMVLFFAIITGAHFFPYGWLYNCKPFYIMSPVLSIIITVIGWSLVPSQLWIIPFSMVILLLLLIFMLFADYKRKLTVNLDISNPTHSI
ncbi:hypothetical protein HHO41_12120 [Bacillus sp. DNRA2]|uniref:DUF7010 family protein n=1 Tax=Bacillus sp. DNRA2 TaxID=2723053 RepID=UPI00145F52E9|nr:hypothetical protein [Bacillus sp. DNRA2]NMD71043.1 hypothetical protein [Bacillus sp. DNRA2]